MGVIVYYSEISGQKEVKKRQQRVMMILDSKSIPYMPIDITDPARENEKDFMLKNAKTKGDAKYVLSPQIFNDEEYCGDFDDFELANENDELESFLKCPKAQNNNIKVANGTSRESSAEAEKKVEAPVEASETPVAEEPAPATTDEVKEVEAEPEAEAEEEADE
ncbi:SH3 domain-binding glutamic acid-rich protein [Orchesella cincta]|uniref:SH3 domain-binding glutamic acid-rich protein n=1 Tax=Orchesella cincta TaxID=48709 RepID=A0A1D2NM23_ORCCI|nr:SH3 domain-binding glutamic acid-rich protein [Orchesella cincta]